MNLSIGQRLATMFAAASVVMLALISFAMHGLLKGELERHQASELEARWQMNKLVIAKASRWSYVRDKFDAVTPSDGRVRLWVFSDDSQFRYGAPLPGIAGPQAVADGFGELALREDAVPMKTFTATVEGNGERPPVKLMVAIDATPFVETLRAFTVGLIALTLLGAVVVAAFGYYIAGIGLRPLGRMSREAQALTPERLSQRLLTATLPPELSKLAGSFNGALDRLEKAYQQLEAFNADVAHELRTPLGNLIGQTQVTLARERSTAELKESLHSNLEDLERMRAIVNDMLFLARADRGETAPNRKEVSLAEEIGRTVEFLEFILEEAGVTVSIEGDVRANIETSLFRRALTNLLQNAVQHSPRGARIVVSVTQQQGVVSIAVRNPGPGIAREHLGRLFDRFYRVDSARSGSSENHGLGLAIVKAVAAMHGGAVFAKSDDDATTIGFTVAAAA
jgi:two-component system heavy metal sensor histidine kinase CusS